MPELPFISRVCKVAGYELERSKIHLNPAGKENSKRKHDSFIEDEIKIIRERIK
jgi:hypothetical protein